MTEPIPRAVEAAAKALYERCQEDTWVPCWSRLQPSRRKAYRTIARVVLEAAERAR